jgi:hypothetical protein
MKRAYRNIYSWWLVLLKVICIIRILWKSKISWLLISPLFLSSFSLSLHLIGLSFCLCMCVFMSKINLHVHFNRKRAPPTFWQIVWICRVPFPRMGSSPTIYHSFKWCHLFTLILNYKFRFNVYIAVLL